MRKTSKEMVITVNKLSKSYEDNKVISNITLFIEPGEVVAIFGPNGCGKSTILNILSGVVEKTSGKIKINNSDSKKFSYIFQNYRESLLPWQNNYENIAFPLRLNGTKEEEINKKIIEMEKIFQFEGNLKRYPYELSGGQQQILAFMRALVVEPKLLFIDEPFSALDYENNLHLRKHLQNYYSKYKPTILVITHDIEEAVHLANKILVLSKKPTKIIEIIENNTPFPRGTNFLKTKKFGEVKEKVLDAFQKGAKV